MSLKSEMATSIYIALFVQKRELGALAVF